MTCLISQAADPSVILALGDPTPHKAAKEFLDYPAKITNKRAKSVWVYSVLGDSTWLYYSAYTRSHPQAKWEMLPYAMCGVGASAIELKPGASFSFTTCAPAEDVGLRYRIEVMVKTSLEGKSESIQVISPAVVIPKVQQGVQ